MLRTIEQAGAIRYRASADNAIGVLLVTSRRNGSWGIPKGQIEAAESSAVAAAREAMGEGGVSGGVSRKTIGSFDYTKEGSDLSYHTSVHLLEVKETLADFPEKQSRRLKWTPLDAAVNQVRSPGFGIFCCAQVAVSDCKSSTASQFHSFPPSPQPVHAGPMLKATESAHGRGFITEPNFLACGSGLPRGSLSISFAVAYRTEETPGSHEKLETGWICITGDGYAPSRVNPREISGG